MDRCPAMLATAFALICLQTLSCHAAATGNGAATNTAADGCMHRGSHIPVGGEVFADECTKCVCTPTALSCELINCPFNFCDDPIDFEGECCDVCPYGLPVYNIQPLEPTPITAGKVNNVVFDLVTSISHGPGVAGDDLIKVSAWVEDEEGNRVGYLDQVLTDEQASTDVTRPHQLMQGYGYTIHGIEFALDASDATCSEMKYLCVELAKGDNPIVDDPRRPFTVEGVVGERNSTVDPSKLIGCVEFHSCAAPDGCTFRGSHIAVDDELVVDKCTKCVCHPTALSCDILSCPSIFCDNPIVFDDECCDICPYALPVYNVQPSEPAPITAGKVNNIVFDLVISILAARGVAGDNLIKVSAWAADEEGNRVGYVDQVLTDEQASTDIIKPIFFSYWGYNNTIHGIEFALDASDATCSELKYLCAELAKGENPIVADPRLPFTVEGVVGERNSTEDPSNLIGCVEFASCTDTWETVSFSVVKRSSQVAQESVAVSDWSDVFNNVGGVFNPEMGIFTAPVTGSYFFTYHITVSANGQVPEIRLMKNEDVVLAGSSTIYSIILDLEAGDTVWLQLEGALDASSKKFVMFSGFLV